MSEDELLEFLPDAYELLLSLATFAMGMLFGTLITVNVASLNWHLGYKPDWFYTIEAFQLWMLATIGVVIVWLVVLGWERGEFARQSAGSKDTEKPQ